MSWCKQLKILKLLSNDKNTKIFKLRRIISIVVYYIIKYNYTTKEKKETYLILPLVIKQGDFSIKQFSGMQKVHTITFCPDNVSFGFSNLISRTPYQNRILFLKRIQKEFDVEVEFHVEIEFAFGMEFDIEIELVIGIEFDIEKNFNMKKEFYIEKESDIQKEFDVEIEFDVGIKSVIGMVFDIEIEFDVGIEFVIEIEFDIEKDFDMKKEFDIGIKFDIEKELFDFENEFGIENERITNL